MVISHKYKYVFIELPRTASSVISNELVTRYSGEKVLNKHATYRDIKKFYPNEAESYFIFSGMRNPIDKTVSIYYKIKSYYNDPQVYKRKGRRIMNFYMKQRREFVVKNDASFEEFFMKFYNRPYDDWASLDHKKFDFLIRYENLEKDFFTFLKKMDIEPVRPLPIINKTEGKKENYIDLFKSNEVKKRATYVFHCYMNNFEYNFPSDWIISGSNCRYWKFLQLFRKQYWKYWSRHRVKVDLKINK